VRFTVLGVAGRTGETSKRREKGRGGVSGPFFTASEAVAGIGKVSCRLKTGLAEISGAFFTAEQGLPISANLVAA
jgi:hypothetical protein